MNPIRSAVAAALMLVAVGCDYDIPSLTGGGSAAGGAGGTGGGACLFSGCPECAEGLACHETMGCVKCLVDGDCTDPAAPICHEHRCVRCTVDTVDTACDADDTCVENQCEQGCNEALDCAGSEDCVLGRCVRCTNNANCFDGEVCDVDAGDCRGCVTDDDCVDDDGGSRPRCSADQFCVACLVSEDCPQPARCQADHSCQPLCCSSADCVLDSAYPSCDTETSTCVPCATTADCLRGECDVGGGRCRECQNDDGCSGDLPACVNEICRECSATRPCADPNVCVENRCFAPTP